MGEALSVARNDYSCCVPTAYTEPAPVSSAETTNAARRPDRSFSLLTKTYLPRRRISSRMDCSASAVQAVCISMEIGRAWNPWNRNRLIQKTSGCSLQW